jgi:hypothetical protein
VAIDKLRYALHVLFTKNIRDWRALDRISAVEWLQRWLGKRAYRLLWHRLFELKPKPADPNVAQNHVPGSEAGSSAIKLAQAASSSKSDAAPLSPSSDERKASESDNLNDQRRDATGTIVQQPAPPAVPAELRKSVDVPAEQSVEVAPGNAEASPVASEPVKPAPTADPPKPIAPA